MHGRRVVPGACVLVPLLVLTLGAPAGAQCLEGTRPLITRERAFFKDTLRAIETAIPDPPAGWRIAEKTEVRAPRGICIGRERQPLEIEYLVRLERADAGGARPGLLPVADGARPPREARILVTVNAKEALFDHHAERLSLPDVTLALSDDADTAGRTSLGLLIGDWSLFRPDDPSESLQARAHFDNAVVYTRVQSISVTFEGPTARVADLSSELDVLALRKLLPKARPASGGRR